MRPLLRSLFCIAWLAPVCVACPKATPPPVFEAASRSVELAAHVVGAAGVNATVTGTLERRKPDGVALEGTAVVLGDGTTIYLFEGPPPDGWEWMIGTRVRVQGKLWEKAPEGWPVAKLLEPESPMPADVTIGLGPIPF